MKVLLATVALTLAAMAVQAGGGRTPKPVIEAARAGSACVAPPEVMRRTHMDLLKHQRDDTVRGGIRGAKASLKECIACHASAKTGSVAASPTNFCISCHQYSAVKIDCFECHSTKPHAAATAAVAGARK